MIRICEMYIIHWNPGIHSKHWRLSWFRYETFINFLNLGFRHQERETQFFYADCSSIVSSKLTASPYARAHTRSPQTALASPMSEKSTCFVSVHISTHCFYSKSLRIPAHRFRAWRHSYPQPRLLSMVFIVTSMIVTSFPLARELLR